MTHAMINDPDLLIILLRAKATIAELERLSVNALLLSEQAKQVLLRDEPLIAEKLFSAGVMRFLNTPHRPVG